MLKSIYIIGSLRNPRIPIFANRIQELGIEAYADWFSPGPGADDYFRDYSNTRNRTYAQALESHAAKIIFEHDVFHLNRCDAAVLLMNAGKSAHLELGYTIGRGKPGYLVFEEMPERYDIMTQFATKIFFSVDDFIGYLKLGVGNEQSKVGPTFSSNGEVSIKLEPGPFYTNRGCYRPT